MGSDWVRFQVEDLFEQNRIFIGDGYRAKRKEFGLTGIPFARVSNINEGLNLVDTDLFPLKDLHKVGDKVSPDSDRGVIERNTISLLNNFCENHNHQKPIDPASDNWLGNYAKSDDINKSSLWNINYVRECYDPNFLDLFEQLVSQMITT